MSPIMTKDEVRDHFDQIAPNYDYWKKKNSYYYNTLKLFISRIIPKGASVLEFGCGTGEILAHMEPSRGVGVDISEEMISRAREKYPQYEFLHAPCEDVKLEEKFDYIIMVDVVDHVYDVQDVFRSAYRFCKPTTKIILTTINPWWDPILNLMEKMGAKMPEGPHNFIERRSMEKMLNLLDLSVSYHGHLLLFPKYVPVLGYLANWVGTRLWPFSKMASTQYLVIQPLQENTTDLGYGCSVVIPCYNEEGNVESAVRRVPHMGKRTEIIVVNDGSTDGTADKVRSLQGEFPNLKLIDYSPNRGKGQAVKAGFDAAEEEVIMILDADVSTPPEEMPRFFEPLNKGMCQFVNGTRLVYPMEDQAMRMANLLGNKLFGWLMSFITQQDLTDTLCGTKALYKRDYKRMKWGKDKWGDFDLLFGAAKMGSKIMEVPVHYKSRISGESKMRSLQHGLHLLQACWRGFLELVLIPPRDFYIKREE
ncbi:MAG: glycosyltransferase [Candidatus Omnitrophica bacterium]|nr:glycosyltransferase [Candidatus Omnitrophota bacterium]